MRPLILGLLGLISESTSPFITEKDTLAHAANARKYIYDAREYGNKRLYGRDNSPTMLEVAQKITETNHTPGYDEIFHKEEFIDYKLQSVTEKIDEDLEKKVLEKLHLLEIDEEPPLDYDNLKKFRGILGDIWEDINKIEATIKGGDVTKLKEMDLTLLNISQNIKSVSKLFSDVPSIKGEDHKLYAGLLNLSDILVAYLAISARYNRIPEAYIKEFINDRKEENWLMIFYYIWGKLPCDSFKDAASFYLNYDFRKTLEESPFTEEIHDLLQYLEDDTWDQIYRMYLGVQIHGYVQNEGLVEGYRELESLAKEFINITSFESSHRVSIAIETSVVCFANRIVEFIHKQSLKNSIACQERLIYLKVSINMLEYVKRFSKTCDVHKKFHTQLEKNPRFSSVQAISKAIRIYSDALKNIYISYGKVLNNLALEDITSGRSVKEKQEPKYLIYLTDLGVRHESSVFETGLEAIKLYEFPLASLLIKTSNKIISFLSNLIIPNDYKDLMDLKNYLEDIMKFQGVDISKIESSKNPFD